MAEKKNNKKSVLRRKFYKNVLGVDIEEPEEKTVTPPKKKKVKIDEEVFTAICDDMADGMSVEEACANAGVIYRTFRRYVENADEKICQAYTHAREWRGEACLMKIDSIMRKLEAGEIDSASANVLIQTEKWKASKFYPKMYSDTNRTQIVDDSGKAINPFDAFYKEVCDKKDYTR